MTTPTVNGILNRAIRAGLTAAYPFLKLWDSLRGGTRMGAAVIVRYKGRVLLVRHSYRPGLGLPGGRVRQGEDPAIAACRELAEEVGIEADPAELRLVRASKRRKIYEFRPAVEPSVAIDNREVVEARFADPAEVGELEPELKRCLET